MQMTERLFLLAKHLITLLFILALSWLLLRSNPSSLSLSIDFQEMSMEIDGDFVSDTSATQIAEK